MLLIQGFCMYLLNEHVMHNVTQKYPISFCLLVVVCSYSKIEKNNFKLTINSNKTTTKKGNVQLN